MRLAANRSSLTVAQAMRPDSGKADDKESTMSTTVLPEGRVEGGDQDFRAPVRNRARAGRGASASARLLNRPPEVFTLHRN